jgi:hypothetical protein
MDAYRNPRLCENSKKIQDKFKQARLANQKENNILWNCNSLNQNESRCFTAFKDALAHSVTTAFPKENAMMVCVYIRNPSWMGDDSDPNRQMGRQKSH